MSHPPNVLIPQLSQPPAILKYFHTPSKPSAILKSPNPLAKALGWVGVDTINEEI